MSAEVLRRAAALMRERAEAATSGPWEFRPRRGFESMHDSPATIGFVDTAGYFAMLREGTWTTENDMRYVASWHPAVALAVADWLDLMAEDYAPYWSEPYAAPFVPVIEKAYQIARAYLGEQA